MKEDYKEFLLFEQGKSQRTLGRMYSDGSLKLITQYCGLDNFWRDTEHEIATLNSDEAQALKKFFRRKSQA